jgi:hypothetical protein
MPFFLRSCSPLSRWKGTEKIRKKVKYKKKKETTKSTQVSRTEAAEPSASATSLRFPGERRRSPRKAGAASQAYRPSKAGADPVLRRVQNGGGGDRGPGRRRRRGTARRCQRGRVGGAERPHRRHRVVIRSRWSLSLSRLCLPPCVGFYAACRHRVSVSGPVRCAGGWVPSRPNW